ncbi:MAG TPA: NAD(P)-binding domain-containing protein [Acidobacteriota bacterium]|nr:NAD(P)-binding domain-containing protein [Acidobacteriota bacterium]
MSSIGILGGTGEEGRGIAARMALRGVSVRIGSRSAQRAREAAREVASQVAERAVADTGSVAGHENSELPSLCQTLFLTVPFDHAQALIEELGPLWHSRHLLIDVTVPLYFDKGPRLRRLPTTSGSELLRQALPEEVRMAAALKTIPAHLLCHLDRPLDCHEFICGDSEQVRQQARQVLDSIAGVRWIDAGPLRYCQALEAMTMLVIGLNIRHKSRLGRFKVQGIGEG